VGFSLFCLSQGQVADTFSGPVVRTPAYCNAHAHTHVRGGHASGAEGIRAQSVAGARFGEGEGEVEKQPAVYRYASLSSLRYCLLKSLHLDILTKETPWRL